MRGKFILGMFCVAVFMIAAGEYLFTRTTAAQEPTGDAGAKKSSDLFDLLKKDLETNKNVLPPLPMAKPEPAPLAVEEPKPNVPAPIPLPLPSAPKARVQPSEPDVGLPPPVPQVGSRLPAVSEQASPLPPTTSELPPSVPAPPIVPAATDRKPEPMKLDNPPSAPKRDDKVKPAIGTDAPSLVSPAAETTRPKSMPTPVKLKSSPWSIHIEVVDEQSIVTLNVSKKHEFKIVCQHVDLQTAQGTLKVVGKVQISGDAMHGSCENLSIPLYEDRLVLEGSAEVRIRKMASHVSSESKAAVFELKGEKLTLRIGELESSKFIETSWRKIADETVGENVVALNPATARQWSPYGKLRRTAGERDGLPLWSLEGRDGQPVLQFVTRTGGTLAPYEGRMISVFGDTIEQTPTGAVVRVTHIAVP